MPASHAPPTRPHALLPMTGSAGPEPSSTPMANLPVMVSQPHMSWPFVPEPLTTLVGLSEQDVKTLKRKQANRDAARRSKVRRKQEAQALNSRLKELKDETGSLQHEVSSLRAALSEVVEENNRYRMALVDGGFSVDDYPAIPVAFDPPPSPKFVVPGTSGAVSGEHAIGSIPNVLEFSHQYMSRVVTNAPLGSLTEALQPSAESPAIDSMVQKRTPVTLDTNNNEVIYLVANRTEFEGIQDGPLPSGEKSDAE